MKRQKRFKSFYEQKTERSSGMKTPVSDRSYRGQPFPAPAGKWEALTEENMAVIPRILDACIFSSSDHTVSIILTKYRSISTSDTKKSIIFVDMFRAGKAEKNPYAD